MSQHNLKEVPMPKGLGALKTLIAFRNNPLQTLYELKRKYGEIAGIYVGNRPLYFLFHPDHIKHVFIDHHYYYNKQNLLWKKLSPFLGEGLLTSEGDFWKKQRKLLQPIFHRDHISQLAKPMVETADLLTTQWQNHPSEQAIDIWQEMMRLTLQILGKTLLHVDFSEQAANIRQCIDIIVSHVYWQSKRVILLPSYLPTPRNRRFLGALKAFDGLIYQMIAARRTLAQQPFDILGLLFGIEDESTHDKMSDKQMRDELMTFIFAGHETTANALAWTFYLIAQHPETQQKIHDELTKVLARQSPSLQNLAQLTYLDAVLKESMRLYPPVWFLGRQTVQEDSIDGYRIPAGMTIMPSFYFTHRHEDFWERPDSFEPERFIQKQGSEKHPYAYVPFGLGPRQCIGNRFATMEMQLVLATLLQKFKIHLAPGYKVSIDAALTLRPKNGIKLLLEKKI